MSAQVKRRFADMVAYLGKDTKGLELLKLLKDDVNVLRKNLAAAAALAVEEEAVKKLARERADAAEARAAQMELELHSLRQKVASVSHELSSVIAANNTDSEDAEEEMIDKSIQEADARSMMKALRKELRYCPKMESRVDHLSALVDVYERSEISPGLSYKSIWTLGAAVCAITLIRGQVVIRSEEWAKTMETKGVESGFLRHLFQWYGQQNIDMSKDDSAGRLYEAAVNNNKQHHHMYEELR